MPPPGNIDANNPAVLKPLQVVSFWDGRPGHEKQTRGILTALAGLTAMEEVPRSVHPLCGAERLQSLLSFLAARIGPVAPEPGGSPPDLIIGTGAATHIPMLLLKKKCPQARVVTCMTPGFPFKGQMDLCFVPRHDRQKLRDNIFETIGPPNNLIHADTHDRRRGLILIGGLDPKSHHWDSGTVLDQVQTLVKNERDCRWTVSSSPRTPPDTICKLESLAARMGGLEFFSSQNTPPGWIERQYMQNHTVWVTADSVSMVYEALTAGCRVGILPVRWRQKENKFQQGLDFLVKNHYVTPFDAWLSSGHITLAGVRLDEATRCAQELLRRWWPNRLR